MTFPDPRDSTKPIGTKTLFNATDGRWHLPNSASRKSELDQCFIGDGKNPTFNRNPYNGYMNPYYWVDTFLRSFLIGWRHAKKKPGSPTFHEFWIVNRDPHNGLL